MTDAAPALFTNVEMIAALQARLTQAEETRDAARAEATRQTEKSRSLIQRIGVLEQQVDELETDRETIRLAMGAEVARLTLENLGLARKVWELEARIANALT